MQMIDTYRDSIAKIFQALECLEDYLNKQSGLAVDRQAQVSVIGQPACPDHEKKLALVLSRHRKV
jgi:hypothetical protein